MLTTKIKLYIGLALGVTLVTILASLWSAHRMSQLETAATNAKAAAEQAEIRAREMELRAAEYKQKIEYFEGELSALRSIASQQDEQLKGLKNNTENARNVVGRARAVRGIESTTAELCAKLAELGHPCDQAEPVTDR